MSTSVPRRDTLDTENPPGRRQSTRKQFCESLRLFEKDLYKAAWALCDRHDRIKELVERVIVSTWEQRGSSLDQPLPQQLAYKLLEHARALRDTSSGEGSAMTVELGEESSELSAHVHRALRFLSWDLREAFILRDFVGLSAMQCAEILGISHNDARRLISYSRLHMTQELSILMSNAAAGGGQ